LGAIGVQPTYYPTEKNLMLESRQLAWPSYLVSAAITIIPLADTTTSLYPWRLLDSRWRFGAVGLLSNALLLPMVGLLLAFVTATLLDQRITRRVLASIALVGALTCLAALVLFGLDALQTRASVQPQMRLSFAVASAAAVLKTIIAAASFLAIAMAGLRKGRPRASGSAPADAPLFPVRNSIAPAKGDRTT
jgi:hypothetical protein